MLAYKLTPSTVLVLQRGDITRWIGGAIVNAANERMLGGGGVDGAIHRAAGPELLQACKEVPPVARNVRCPTGEARHTKAFDLPVRYVIHTVGPIYDGPEESAPLLESAYRSSLQLANKLTLKSVAFPAISCGVFGYPYDEAAEIALQISQQEAGQLEQIHFVLFNKSVYDAFVSEAANTLEEAEPPEDEDRSAQAAEPAVPAATTAQASEAADGSDANGSKRKADGEPDQNAEEGEEEQQTKERTPKPENAEL
ncbi:hypothetical protein WJX72_012457 [[Myrmecia] bisecta]|uniref:Macro domain-containing protein n=1 Tax=[Myrmecia] bisecta TaxID=41462 RepID=A0AAW1PMD9_9CHLO